MPRHLKMLAVLLALPSVACQTIVQTPPANCAEFIPDTWKIAVAGAQLPMEDTLSEWQKFGVAQSGQLSKESGQKLDIIHIYTVCEKRQNDARPRRKVLGIF